MSIEKKPDLAFRTLEELAKYLYRLSLQNAIAASAERGDSVYDPELCTIEDLEWPDITREVMDEYRSASRERRAGESIGYHDQ